MVSAKVSHEDALERRRRIFLYFVLALVFMRFSMVHQILEHLLHADIYLIYLVAIPALIGVPATGGFKRAFRIPLGDVLDRICSLDDTNVRI